MSLDEVPFWLLDFCVTRESRKAWDIINPIAFDEHYPMCGDKELGGIAMGATFLNYEFGRLTWPIFLARADAVQGKFQLYRAPLKVEYIPFDYLQFELEAKNFARSLVLMQRWKIERILAPQIECARQFYTDFRDE